MDTTFDLLTLALVPGLSPRAARELASRGPLAEALERPGEHADLLGVPAREALRSGAARRLAEAEARRSEALGVRIVGRDEPDYPPWLRRVYAPPPSCGSAAPSSRARASGRSPWWALAPPPASVSPSPGRSPGTSRRPG